MPQVSATLQEKWQLSTDTTNFCGFITSAKKVLYWCLSVYQLPTLLQRFLADFEEIFRITWKWYRESPFNFLSSKQVLPIK